MFVVSNGNSTAITLEKHRMRKTCRNLSVLQSLVQKWDVALSILIVSDGNSTAITPEKHRMTSACRNLDVHHSLIQSWDVASSAPDGNSTAITPEEHCRKLARNFHG
jgi:hypothetical protein